MTYGKNDNVFNNLFEEENAFLSNVTYILRLSTWLGKIAYVINNCYKWSYGNYNKFVIIF